MKKMRFIIEKDGYPSGYKIILRSVSGDHIKFPEVFPKLSAAQGQCNRLFVDMGGTLEGL